MSERPRYVAGCSFGKDSLATVLIAIEHGEPLDEAIYCEVMFNDEISGEVPEHRDFIYNIAIPKLEKMGVKTNVIRDERTYVSSFTRVIKRGKRIGQINSYPICGRCCIQRDCKLPPIKKWKASLAGEVVQYIGLAADEQERLMKDEVRGMVSLLDKYGITEADTFEICKRHELLSPIYEFTDRNGCWFCPNAKRKELRHLYDNHPDLWAKMLELERLPNKATELFNREERFSDIDFLFRMESDREQSKKTLDFLACRGDMGIQAEAKRLGVRKDTLFRWLERQGREMIPGQLSLLDDGFISEGASP